MKKSVVIATFLVVGAGATCVAADVGTTANMKGSDTLFDLTTALFGVCPGTRGTYLGTGSANGEARSRAGRQGIDALGQLAGFAVTARLFGR